jgi:hypothetical protein
MKPVQRSRCNDWATDCAPRKYIWIPGRGTKCMPYQKHPDRLWAQHALLFKLVPQVKRPRSDTDHPYPLVSKMRVSGAVLGIAGTGSWHALGVSVALIYVRHCVMDIGQKRSDCTCDIQLSEPYGMES